MPESESKGAPVSGGGHGSPIALLVILAALAAAYAFVPSVHAYVYHALESLKLVK